MEQPQSFMLLQQVNMERQQFGFTANDGYATTPTTTVQYSVTVNPKPLAAGTMTINGNAGVSTSLICSGNNVTLSIPSVSFATGYTWSLPQDVLLQMVQTQIQ